MITKKATLALTISLTLFLTLTLLAQAAPSFQGGSADDDDDDAGEGGTPPKAQIHPVANRLAIHFETDYEEIMGLHRQGYGFGQIIRAYALTDITGKSPVELIQEAHQIGWGQLLKDNGLHPSQAGRGRHMDRGQGGRAGGGGPPAHAGPPGGDGPPGQVKKNTP